MNKIHVEYSQAVFISCVTFLIHGQAGRSTVWANGTQNLGLVNFVPESRLPFVQISSIYHKTTAKALTRYQRWLWRNGSRISVWIFRPEKQDNLFRCSVAPGNFLMERLKKSSLRGRRSRAQIPPSPSPFNYKNSCAIYFPTGFSGKIWWMVNNHILSCKHAPQPIVECVTLTSSWKVVFKNSVGTFSVSVRYKWLINL